MNKKYQFILPKEAENLSTIRLASSSIASLRGFSIDQIEDLKISISEACNIAIKYSDTKKLELEYTLLDQGIEITLKNLKINKDFQDKKEMSKIILQALVDQIEIREDQISMKLLT